METRLEVEAALTGSSKQDETLQRRTAPQVTPAGCRGKADPPGHTAGASSEVSKINNYTLITFASYSSFSVYCILFIGVDFKIKTVELRGKKIRLQIWDTAGQERFNSITSAYYRSAKGIILVYDITKKETFDDLPKWMKMIDKYASEDAELLLVGNKLDCEVDREITRQQGEKFAQQITGMRFCEASAKDNFNVDEIFLKLVDDILKKMPLDVIRNELSNSILSLQPEPEIPPELPPPRPHVRCC
ncbi:ras-related protein Rab-12 [Cyanistes caeruleus]|uniref:ras-related protein Rab-12 n=1 Tax=Cyanistes caeruleus TaxID=156563 RepID=UPI000CDAA238|nr:ras-related protein Rab-12 [Cyanistes caeruleus]